MTDPVALQARLEAIELAIASGTTRVSIDGVGTTEFRSLADLRSVRDDIRRQLGLVRSGRRTVATYRSGL
jgi:hypothetical protein